MNKAISLQMEGVCLLMAKVTVLLRINDKDFTAEVGRPFKIARNKLWGENSGRLLNGDMDAVLVGIFPKLTVEFLPANETEMSDLLVELDKASQAIEYHDPKTRSLVSLGTYSGDYEITMLNLEPYYDKVVCSFIALRKES